MEDKKAILIAIFSVITLIIIVIIARISLGLSKTFYFICGADIAIIVLVFAYVFIRLRYAQRRRLLEKRISLEGRELRIEYSFLRKVAGVPIKFRHKEIEQATDNFQSLIGKGASASVYRGILGDGTVVAVKRIDGQDRGEKAFRSEVAAIASVQHVNLVRLIGYCSVQSGPRFLVYEFIPNSSLDRWIFAKKDSTSNYQPHGCLSWDVRVKVAIDVAKALSYLHHGCRSRVLHLDIKPENILLDENYRAIVSDFGLSKLMGRDESTVITTIKGTKGYLAPEWLLHHGVSEKCDVYSFGMVLFELIGGQRSVSSIKDHNSKRTWQYFPHIVVEKMREGKLMEVVDPRIASEASIDEEQVRRLVYVALWCIQEKPRLRPAMDHVVEMLEGHVNVEEPPDTKMIIVDLLSTDKEKAGDGKKRPHKVVVPPAGHQLGSQMLPSPSSVTISMSTVSGR